MDEYNQAGLKRAYEWGIGVVIMEPLRGGNLAAKAPDKVKEKFGEYSKKRSPAHRALRWLSGMNINAHINKKIKVASETTPDSMTG